MTRRLPAILIAVLLLCRPATGREEEREVPDFPETTRESQEKVERGLDFLARSQGPDGRIGGEFPVATTSLACLSFLAHGNSPGRGKYGENIRMGLRYILACAKKHAKGFITETEGGKTSSRMHGHGYAALFLAEVLGMTEGSSRVSFKEVRDALTRAIRVIEQSQTRYSKVYGGWGYEPSFDMPDEASVTVTAVQALRAARNAGIAVDTRVVERAVEYVKACFDPSDGSFRYSIAMSRQQSTLALTSAAVSTLNYLGTYEGEEVDKGLEYIMRNLRSAGHGMRGRSGHYFYESFYTTLATYYAGGTYWRLWCPKIREDLVNSASADGSWQGEYDPEYCTAFATLLLQVPNRYLPIFQR